MGVIVGIDCGVGGAIGALDDAGEFVGVWDMPIESLQSGKNRVSAVGLAGLLRDVGDCRVIVEDVHSLPRDGHQAAFRFGDSAGCVRGVVQTLGLHCEYVTPGVWKKKQGLLKVDKDYSRTFALGLWPSAPLGLKKHHGRAESLLIARHLVLLRERKVL